MGKKEFFRPGYIFKFKKINVVLKQSALELSYAKVNDIEISW